MFDIQEELKKLPQKPGVYLMKDENGHIIYVGKAVNLKNRVRQYFQSSRNQTAKTRSMVPNIREFEYIVTDSAGDVSAHLHHTPNGEGQGEILWAVYGCAGGEGNRRNPA